VVDDLAWYRGPGPRKSLWRSLLLAGFRFSASNLQDPRAPLPHTVALSGGTVLDAAVQHRLVDHLGAGGSLLLTGRLPQRDPENRPCRVLADALGLRAGPLMHGTNRYYPSLLGHGLAQALPETRIGWLASLEGASLQEGRADPVFTDVEGRICAVTVDLGPGRAVVATSELPSHPALFTALAGWLGSAAGLRLRTSVPGVAVTTGVTPRGERMLHVLNPTGYAATIQVDIDDPTGLLTQPLAVPARTGAMLGLGLQLPGGGTIASSNAEVAEVTEDRLRLAPGLSRHTQVWLRTDRRVIATQTRVEGDLTVITGPAGAALDIAFS
jgi:beta-galactosidase